MESSHEKAAAEQASIQMRTDQLLERHKKRIQKLKITTEETEGLKEKIRAKLEEHKNLMEDNVESGDYVIHEEPNHYENSVDQVNFEEEEDLINQSMNSQSSSVYAPVRGQGSSGRDQHDRIEDHLIARGKAKKQYMSEQRDAHQRNEAASFPFQPQISESAKALQRDGPFEVRMAKEHDRLLKKKEMQRLQREQEASINQPTFTPTINKHVQVDVGPGNVVERTRAWEASKERKRIQAIYESRSKESQEATHRPQINVRSNQMVAGKRAEDVAEYLYNLAPAQRANLEHRQEEDFYMNVPGNPAITRMAAELQREGPIGERLYANAVEQQLRHRERIERAELEKIERAKAAAAFHSNSQRDMRNMAYRGSGSRSNGTPEHQGHSLYNRAQQTLKKKDKMRQLESKAKEALARPKLSKRSLKIANKMER